MCCEWFLTSFGTFQHLLHARQFPSTLHPTILQLAFFGKATSSITTEAVTSLVLFVTSLVLFFELCRHAHRVLTSLGESVTSLPSDLASLQWAHQLCLEKTQLVCFILLVQNPLRAMTSLLELNDASTLGKEWRTLLNTLSLNRGSKHFWSAPRIIILCCKQPPFFRAGYEIGWRGGVFVTVSRHLSNFTATPTGSFQL